METVLTNGITDKAPFGECRMPIYFSTDDLRLIWLAKGSILFFYSTTVGYPAKGYKEIGCKKYSTWSYLKSQSTFFSTMFEPT